MLKPGWCEGEQINLAAAAVAGLLMKTFTRREITVIVAFLSVLVSSLGSMLVANAICSSTPPTDEVPEEVVSVL